jgi:hypothetical protein
MGEIAVIILKKAKIKNLFLFLKIKVVYFGFAVRLPLIFNLLICLH